MSKRKYKDIRFHGKSLETIERVNAIVEEYEAQGYELTLRQVYYQLVARGFIPNNERSYKNLGSLINDGRLAGLIDWYAIVDRTRNLRRNSHWNCPEDVIDSARYSYMLDRWENQPNYVEVWVEKDALIGIVSQICRELDVPHFSCRGYTSQSEMWSAAQRFIRQNHRESRTIIYLGDHDPSGIDMTRDIQERMDMFGADVYVKRVALTMEQIEKFSPPPNPTKLSDARASGYIEEYGHECWELDALEPKVITSLIRDEVTALCDSDLLYEIEHREETDKTNIKLISQHYERVVGFIHSEVV
nr:MAG TPA: type II DNA topoisomerase VI [Caudoviricetes sp.]